MTPANGVFSSEYNVALLMLGISYLHISVNWLTVFSGSTVISIFSFMSTISSLSPGGLWISRLSM